MKSNFTDPYGHLPSDEKQAVHGAISKDDFTYLFSGAFPRQGSQNRIIAMLLQKYKAACVAAHIPPFHDPRNEEIGQSIIDSLTFTPPELHPYGKIANRD